MFPTHREPLSKSSVESVVVHHHSSVRNKLIGNSGVNVFCSTTWVFNVSLIVKRILKTGDKGKNRLSNATAVVKKLRIPTCWAKLRLSSDLVVFSYYFYFFYLL